MMTLKPVVVMSAVLVLSGCAMIQSGRHIEVSPTNPKEEMVTRTHCSPWAYPFGYTVNLAAEQHRKCLAGDGYSTQGQGCDGVYLGAWLIGPLVEVIMLPATLPAAIFTSDCSTETTVQANPNYRDTSGRPAQIALSRLEFSEPSGSGVLQGGDTGSIKFTLSNSMNAGAAKSVTAHITAAPSAGLRIADTITLGDLEPGTSRQIEIPVAATERVPSGKATISLRFEEASHNPPDPAEVRISTRRLHPPRFAITAIGLDDGAYTDPRRLALGNGNGTLDPGESVEVSIDLSNSGEGAADGVTVELIGADDKDLRVLENDFFKRRYEVGILRPHATKRIVYAISLSRLYTGSSTLPLSLRVSERRSRFDATLPLGITIGRRMLQFQVVDVNPIAQDVPTAAVDYIDTPPASLTPMNPDALAVVVGIGRYREKGIPPVDFATQDADTVYAYLTKAMGYDAKNVALLTDEQATKGDLEKYLGSWLKNRATSKSTVFVYYAGHGTPDPKTGEAYLVPFDGDAAYAADTAFPLKRLYQSLARLPATRITIALDACFSGAGGRSIAATGTRPLMTVQSDFDSVGKNMVVLAAAAGDQISSSYPAGHHGLLTLYLLKGLHGDADLRHDGKITTDELFEYVRPAVERQARLQNIEQVPTLTPSVSVLGDRARDPWISLRR